MMLFFDAAPVSGGMAVFVAVAFFFLLLGVALVAYKLLKRSVKMAVRMIIVSLILAVAVAGSVFLFFAGTSPSPRPTARPPASR
jgi:hypothetical protein